MTVSPLFRFSRRVLGAALLSTLLVGCTGTQEPALDVRLGLITDGGQTLGYADQLATPDGAVTARFTRATPLATDPNGAGKGVGLLNLNSGSNAILTTTNAAQLLDANLSNPQPFNSLNVAYTPSPCLIKSVLSPTGDRLLTLSDCQGNQKVALFNVNRTLIWYANLSARTASPTGNDTPPTRIAVLGDVGIVARPALGGGSEVIRVAPRTPTGDPAQDLIAVVGDPLPSMSIRDLAAVAGSPSVIYAATDSGVRPLQATGVPDASSGTNSQVAFGSARVDRLWSGLGGSRRVLAAWRDNEASGNGSEPLRLWDVARTTAVTVANFSSVRDLTFDLNGQLYVLTRKVLSRYDTSLGFQQGSWNGKTLLTTLNDPQAITWLIAPVTDK
ncbi:hypothetical protein [Deinococcus sp.]|uniref:hypothetical protein n=1 Tax=Deinococcus sp. TaxID=47478 RepID=UPI0025C4E10F|nr:hypothetical protein [Deinococcus sp.]